MNTRMTIEKTPAGEQLVTINELINSNSERIDIAVLLTPDPRRTVHMTQVLAVTRAHKLLDAWLQAAQAGD